MAKQKLRKIINQIVKLAKEVYGELGSGFDECVYQKAMEVGLRLAKVRYENQKVVELKFKDHYVGEGYPDLVVNLNDIKLVLELKAVASKLGGKEETQIRSYMKILKIPYGLLINFQSPGTDVEKETQLEIREITL
jgi:GxxExxY protein